MTSGRYAWRDLLPIAAPNVDLVGNRSLRSVVYDEDHGRGQQQQSMMILINRSRFVMQ